METEGSLPCSEEPAIGPTMSQMNPVRNFHPVSLRSIEQRETQKRKMQQIMNKKSFNIRNLSQKCIPTLEGQSVLSKGLTFAVALKEVYEPGQQKQQLRGNVKVNVKLSLCF
jgi:hypothetical protein